MMMLKAMWVGQRRDWWFNPSLFSLLHLGGENVDDDGYRSGAAAGLGWDDEACWAGSKRWI